MTFSREGQIYEVASIQENLVRAEECSNICLFNGYGCRKIERQIRKHKTKLGKRIRQDAMIPENYTISEN